MARRSRHQRERRQRLWRVLVKLVLILAAVGAVGAFAYDIGRQLSRQEIRDLRTRIDTLSTTAEAHSAQVSALRAALARAQDDVRTYRDRYESVAPEAIRKMVDVARRRIDEGLSPDRLSFALSQIQPPRNCTPAQTRRFIAKTENYDGANTWVRFNDLVTVSGRGTAGAGGTAEWFDPNRPVTVTFTPLGAATQSVSGTLPLEHAMVVKGKEYRFTAAPGPRSFIEITADRCDFMG